MTGYVEFCVCDWTCGNLWLLEHEDVVSCMYGNESNKPKEGVLPSVFLKLR